MCIYTVYVCPVKWHCLAQAIAEHCNDSAALLLSGLIKLGCTATSEHFFDTIAVKPPDGLSVDEVIDRRIAPA